jgi:hypothetical protein
VPRSVIAATMAAVKSMPELREVSITFGGPSNFMNSLESQQASPCIVARGRFDITTSCRSAVIFDCWQEQSFY